MYQGKLAEKLPCGRQILEKDVELLKLLDKEKNVDSFEYSPSPPPSNIFNFSNVSELPILTISFTVSLVFYFCWFFTRYNFSLFLFVTNDY